LKADAASSELLIGQGEVVTLSDLQNSFSTFQSPLVTLSACNTADSMDGKEFSSLVEVVESQGAPAVIATLWPVADSSAPELMRGFYRYWLDHPNKGKAEALRQAQLVLLHGGDLSAGALQQAQQDVDRSDTAHPERHAKPFDFDPKKPYAHPYYWAPFQLFGNWK